MSESDAEDLTKELEESRERRFRELQLQLSIYLENFKELKRLLVKDNVNVNCVSEGGRTPLHTAVNYISIIKNDIRKVKLLIQKGADVNQRTEDNGETPLHIACETGFAKAAAVLLRNRANMTLVNFIGQTPLFLAVLNDKLNIAKLLLSHGIEIEKYRSYYELIGAIINNNYILARGLIDVSEDINFKSLHGESPLYFAVCANRPQMVEYLLSKGAEINRMDIRHISVLHIAIQKGHIGVVRILLDHGANIECPPLNMLDFEGIRPLFYTALFGRPTAMRLLIERGADVNGWSIAGSRIPGNTALQAACACANISCVKLLLSNGADIHRKDENGNTALNLAASHAKDKGNKHSKVIELLLGLGADPHTANANGETPLHWASFARDRRILNLLFEYKVNTGVKDDNGRTPLHWAISFAPRGRNSDILEALLRNGPNHVNTRDKEGNTPFFSITRTNCEDLLVLLRYGGDVNLANQDHMMPSLKTKCGFNKHKCPMIDHFLKIQLLGWKMNPVTELGLPEILRAGPKEKAEEVAKFLKELEDLKKVNIATYPRKTLHDFLFFRRNRLFRYADNKVLVEIYERNGQDFEKQYPHYGFLLNLNYRRALERKALMDSAQRSLDLIVGAKVPPICGDLILKTFTDRQLEEIGVEHFDL